MSQSDDNDDDQGAGQAFAQLFMAGGDQAPLSDDFQSAFSSIKTQQTETGLGSRNGGNYRYLPNLSGPAAHVNVTQNMRTATNFFMSKGWTQAQAVGIVANLYSESALNPASRGDNGLAYGIGQWHPDRQAAFQRQFGIPIQGASFEQQLEFVNYELTQGDERNAGRMLHQATTAGDAAATVSRYYERPADLWGAMKQRYATADAILNKLNNGTTHNGNYALLASNTDSGNSPIPHPGQSQPAASSTGNTLLNKLNHSLGV